MSPDKLKVGDVCYFTGCPINTFVVTSITGEYVFMAVAWAYERSLKADVRINLGKDVVEHISPLRAFDICNSEIANKWVVWEGLSTNVKLDSEYYGQRV
jgi:hypothetical protein